MEELTPEEVWIYVKNTTLMTFVQKYQDAEELAEVNKPLREKVLKEFHEYLKVFSKEASERFPEHKSWDHKIETKPGYEPKAQKVFSLPQDEVKLAEDLCKRTLERVTSAVRSRRKLYRSFS